MKMTMKIFLMNTTDTYLALSVPFYSARQEDLSFCFNPLNNLVLPVTFIPFYVLNLTCIEQFFLLDFVCSDFYRSAISNVVAVVSVFTFMSDTRTLFRFQHCMLTWTKSLPSHLEYLYIKPFYISISPFVKPGSALSFFSHLFLDIL